MIQYDGNDCYDVNIGSIKGKFSEQDILDFVDELIESESFGLKLPVESNNFSIVDSEKLQNEWHEGHISGYDDGYFDGEKYGRQITEDGFKCYKTEMINKLEELFRIAKGY